ncbi:MAG: HAD family hydrolase [Phenylobacterium sp.]|uniref:HAD-IIB family hydrolase n=1 Tax=Phenylobacterium sp. TaxID=1871053 RepID=UPI002732931D|nr:HAD family hydrolase [Phenylobacterium sp.]MDP3747464.1 HAD family hydrolase [Phenylobacterium sp.]
MYLIAFATDYDGTLAHHGLVDAPTIAALERLRASGRKLLMVTGRDLPDLKRVFERFDLFEVVVAENGALLYFPATQEERPLAAPPPPELVRALADRGVQPLSVGRGIVATWEPNESAVLDCIRDLGLEWQIIFNKGAVMVLPPGVNKATGLTAALQALDLSPLNVIAIGDAENDHAFLTASGCAVAVANALDAVKATADLVTRADHGAGVAEVIDVLLADESALARPAAERRRIRLGDDETATLQADGGAVLIAGTSGIGKSTLATAIIEKLAAQGFQVCALDPEGDYHDMPDAIVLGDAEHTPVASEALDILRKPDTRPLVVNMLGLPVRDRPGFFAALVPKICELRARFARPHWLVIDEAHHMLPAGAEAVPDGLPKVLSSAIYVTVHPDAVRPAALVNVRTLIGVGPKAGDVVESFCRAIDARAPSLPPPGGEDQVLFWDRASGAPPRWIKVDRPTQDHQRHTRKYAQGELGEDKSFYFRGPDDALRLRAQNLTIFLQMADGVDDATWLHHLRRGDYALWFREAIKDDDLADEAERLQGGDDPAETRQRMREMVERRYTAPVKAP